MTTYRQIAIAARADCFERHPEIRVARKERALLIVCAVSFVIATGCAVMAFLTHAGVIG